MPNKDRKKELTRQTIIRVKEKIAALDLTEAEVLQRMTEAGETTSATTVHRFLADGSEDTGGFNYSLTVKPFARVFLELSSAPVDVATLDTETEKDLAALDNIIQLKNFQIDSLESELATSRRSIDFLKEQVDFKERQMTTKDAQIAAKDTQLDERAGYLRDKDAQIASLKDELAMQKKISRRLFTVWCATLLALIVALMSDSILRLL